mmetsp:Transcript_30525/g.76789  ORF Transcript_30525/g.76789 Transcript_30525/m.76789 type:complete len:201 (-) Transcript_30525:361-963(-)
MSITTTVVLSRVPSFRARSVSALAAPFMPLPWLMASWAVRKAWPSSMTSHNPSLARIIISSTWVRGCDDTSGSAVTQFFIGLLPNARDTASRPFTRPSTTQPPDLSMRAISSGRVGLWSLVSTRGAPACLMTALESPAWATMMRPCCTSTTTAVDPESSPRSPTCSMNPRSVFTKAERSAWVRSWVAAASAMAPGRCFRR